MVQLFLSEPEWERGTGGYVELGKMWLDHLGKLESALWSLMMSGGWSEARLWLPTSDIGDRFYISPPSGGGVREAAEKQANQSGSSCSVASDDFREEASDGGRDPGKEELRVREVLRRTPEADSAVRDGVQERSQSLVSDRDICWEELDWKGKHGQSPLVVATKPYYLLDLDVQRTIENFIDNVPEFWSSSEFAESLKDGDIISIDTKFFEEFFLDFVYKDYAKDVWAVISEFLIEESFSSLCHHLLITLEEQEFCTFLQLLGMYVKPRKEPNDVGGIMYWLELLISRSYATMDELLLINAVINQGRKLLRLMHDEEFEDERDKIKESLSRISTLSCNANSLVPLLNECVRSKLEKTTKLLGLQSWALHCALAEEYRSPQSWESLLSMNQLSFKKSDEYELIDDNGLVESDNEASKKRKQRKKKKSRKKRRRLMRRTATTTTSWNLGHQVTGWTEVGCYQQMAILYHGLVGLILRGARWPKICSQDLLIHVVARITRTDATAARISWMRLFVIAISRAKYYRKNWKLHYCLNAISFATETIQD